MNRTYVLEAVCGVVSPRGCIPGEVRHAGAHFRHQRVRSRLA
jgi:hypothetical protein